MTIREQAIKEIQDAPEEVVRQTLDFLRFLAARVHAERMSAALASEARLAEDWDTAAEDEAWQTFEGPGRRRPFPFSDLSLSKRRPALVVAEVRGDDLILCQITSQDRADPDALPLESADFAGGGLSRGSFVRPGRLF